MGCASSSVVVEGGNRRTPQTNNGGRPSSAASHNVSSRPVANDVIPPDTPVPIPTPPQGWDARCPPLTLAALDRERETFWDTRVQGNREFWNGLRLAVTADDDFTRGLILSSIGATRVQPADASGFFCYDERGARYDIPWIIALNPSNMVSSSGILGSPPAAGLGSPARAPQQTAAVAPAPTDPTRAIAFPPPPDAEPSPAAAAAAVATAPLSAPPAYSATASISPGAATPAAAPVLPVGPLVRFHVLVSSGGKLTVEAPDTTTRRDITRLVKAKFQVPALRQRVVVRGFSAVDDALTLKDMRVTHDNVVQVFIIPEDVADIANAARAAAAAAAGPGPTVVM